ncbi:MAG TPA: hypothetical protein VG796_22900 [Verrucomicrobiales bacterium]|nr:hypothetical protein [Verrucomicrobiales bacterium]
MSDSSPSSRSLVSSPLFWLAILILLTQSWIYWNDTPGPGLALESAASYHGFKAGKWTAALTLDASPQPDVSVPYCGWPPLYTTGLCLLSLTGLPFWAAGLFYNFLLIILTGWITVRIFSLLRCQWDAGLVFFLVTVCPALLFQFRFVYPVFSTPLAIVTVFYGALRAQEDPRAFWKWAVICGLVAGLSSWVAFMTAPALFLSYAWQARRHGDRVAAIVVRWSIAAGVVMAVAFVAFRLASAWALAREDVITSQISGGSSKLIERAFPGIKAVAAAWFYNTVRGGYVLIPIVVLIALLRVRFTALYGARPLFAAALLTPVIFTLVLPGEFAPSAHIFHGAAWLHVAFFAPLLFGPSHPFAARRTRLAAAGTFILFALLYTQGYRVLPASAFSNPNITAEEVSFRAPGDWPPNVYRAPTDMGSVIRTTFKQGFYMPPLFAKTIEGNPQVANYAKWHGGWQRTFQPPLDDRKIVVAWTAQEASNFTWSTGRVLESVNNFEEMRHVFDKLEKRGLLPQTALIVPDNSDTAGVLAALEPRSLTLAPRPVADTGFTVLAIVPK